MSPRRAARAATASTAASAVGSTATRWWLLVLVEAGLVAAGLVELLLETKPAWSFDFAYGVLGVVAIIARRRMRWVSFLATLPALYVTGILIPTLITLFAVAERSRHRWMLFAASAVVAVLWLSPWDYAPRLGVLLDAIYALMFGIAPTALGLLVQTRRDLSQRLAELTEARRIEQEAAEQKIVAAERARIAREMHDVVSHQVSLIAVQAGALQVATDDGTTAEAARNIRLLSVRTLDELRNMVGVLRASGSGSTELTPQPTLAELDRLVSGSGVRASVVTPPPVGLPQPVQRTFYRAVQEGLTNVRKHAPGAATSIVFSATSRVVVLTVENGPSVQEPVDFPSSRHGLIGLRERADLLGGSLTAEPLDNGGFRLRMTLPVSSGQDA